MKEKYRIVEMEDDRFYIQYKFSFFLSWLSPASWLTLGAGYISYDGAKRSLLEIKNRSTIKKIVDEE